MRGELSRRRFLAGAGAVGAAGLLPGCSGDERGSEILQVWGGVPAASGPGKVVEAFQRKFPQYKVNYTRFVNDPRGNLKLDTALQGGLDIDVYFTYTSASLALRAGSGMAADLTDRVKADLELALFLDAEQPRAFVEDGRVKALATAREPYFVLVNETLRRQAGVELPRRWTIDEFRATARSLTTDRTVGAYTVPDLARISLGPDYWYGEDGKSNFDDPVFEQTLATGRAMIDEGSTFRWSEVLARHLNTYQQNSFLKAEFNLWPTAPFNLRYLYDGKLYPHDFKVGFVPPPTVPGGGDWNGGSYNNFVMMNPKSAKTEAAWQFIKFWLTEGSAPMLAGGKIPTLGNVTDDQLVTGLLGKEPDKYFDLDSFRRVVLQAEPKLATDTKLAGFPEITLAYNQQRDLCWLGEKAPGPAIREVYRLANAAIARNEGSA
ncbi:ABC transporter substrate-binding protein [Kribbella catacumbae]|uniref:ABC transporter substrate-binding protein n=1 Tax=Kribbella catacumbae TaxID=460086 RepID=UPI0007C4D64E|nr:extracellular solute-binding protein [Kribbella catacumbae]